MNEEVQLVYEMARKTMEKAIEHLDNELVRIRAGKANVHILDGVLVDYYGTPTPLNQVSNVSTPDANHHDPTLGKIHDRYHRKGVDAIQRGDHPVEQW
jgi:precorrin-4 methylase